MRTKDAMKKNNKNKKPKPIKEITQEWWTDLPMCDRYKFAYDKVWEDTPNWIKPLITGVDTEARHYKDFTSKVVLFAEEDKIKWN